MTKLSFQLQTFKVCIFFSWFSSFLEPMPSKYRHVLVLNPHTKNSGGCLLSMYFETKKSFYLNV